MRRERMTYIGAYHHVMNRGYDGNDIFAGNRHKSNFLDFLEASTKGMKIRYGIFILTQTLSAQQGEKRGKGQE